MIVEEIVRKKIQDKLSKKADGKKFNGVLMVRMPPTVHEKLVKTAITSGCSLNTLISTILEAYMSLDK